MKKRSTRIFTSLFCSIFMVASCFLTTHAINYRNILNKSSATAYGITFNSTKNKLHSYSGNTGYNGNSVVKTDLGNDVSFQYYQLKGTSTTWHVLGDDGYFQNVTPIRGIQSISLSFKTDNSSFDIEYSGDNSFDQTASFISSTSNNVVFNFNEYLPNYLRIKNTSGANLNIYSIQISLACINAKPGLYLESNSTLMGTVFGGGTKTPGENVTITASPYSGYKFVGWFDQTGLISTQPSYSFVMGYEDITYEGRFDLNSYNLIVQSESESKGSVSNSTGTYDYLTPITIYAYPNSGYSFEGWYSDSTLINANNPYQFNMPYENINYVAHFSANSYQVTLTNVNPSNGTIVGDGNYLYGSNVNLIANPNTGMAFLGWFDENDNLVSIEQNYNFVMPHNDLHLFAKFEVAYYSVNITIDGDLYGTISGDGLFTYGQQVNLMAYPKAHCSFYGWFDNDTLLSREISLTFHMPNESLLYRAVFVQNHSIYLFSEDEDKGSVDGPTEWGEGLEVTVHAVPNSGYALNYWYDDDLNEISYSADYTFVMPEHDINLFAAFSIGYVLSLSVVNNDTAIINGSGSYSPGRNVTVSASFDSRYTPFKGWYDLNGLFKSLDNPYSFVMPSNDYALVAHFWNGQDKFDLGIAPTINSDTNTVTYGLYPQTVVDENELLSELNALDYSAVRPNGWYEFNEKYYCKCTASPCDSGYKFDNGQTIVSGIVYWFKCEPIKWNLLSESSTQFFITTTSVLDVVDYEEYYEGSRDGHYCNDYKHSLVRNWLNNDFLNTAFVFGSDFIATTSVSSDINDKIFLLTDSQYNKYYNANYKIASRSTDYYRAKGGPLREDNDQGATEENKYNGTYYTRTPDRNCTYYVRAVWYDGVVEPAYTFGLGVRPALNMLAEE